MFLSIFRSLSRNITRRRKENIPFIVMKEKIRKRKHIKELRIKEKDTHVYKKCPKCKEYLRLPKKIGIHTVRCPKCSKEFTMKIK